MYFFTSLVSSLSFLTMPSLSFAQTINAILGNIAGTLNIIYGILITIATLTFIWGIIKFIHSGSGDKEAAKQARAIMGWGIIGLTIIAGAWGVVSIFIRYFGLTNQPINAGIPVLQWQGGSSGPSGNTSGGFQSQPSFGNYDNLPISGGSGTNSQGCGGGDAYKDTDGVCKCTGGKAYDLSIRACISCGVPDQNNNCSPSSLCTYYNNGQDDECVPRQLNQTNQNSPKGGGFK